MIQQIPIEKLYPHPDNEKIYGEENVQELAEQIRESGWIKPLTVCKNGQEGYKVISGHRRRNASLLLGKTELPCEIATFEHEWQEMERLLLENEYRKKSMLQKIEEFEMWKKVESEKARGRKEMNLIQNSDKEIFPYRELGQSRDFAAEKTGFGSGKTAEKASAAKEKMKELESAGETAKADLVRSVINSENIQAALEISQIVDDLKEEEAESAAKKIISKNSSATKVKRDLKKEVNKRRRVKEVSEIEINISSVDFRQGDFIDTLSDIPDNSVDLILTDPPYPKEYLEEWSKLSAFAKRVLKPGGFCVAYSGQVHLPEVINRLSESLDYYWIFSLNHAGFGEHFFSRNMRVKWKPILIFQNGYSKYKPDGKDSFVDVINGTGLEKSHHDWQQAAGEIIPIIEYFTNPNDTIVDPFGGSGTTLIASANLGRKAIGSELLEETYLLAKKRISDEVV